MIKLNQRFYECTEQKSREGILEVVVDVLKVIATGDRCAVLVKLPENLKIIFSGWGSSLRPDNPHGLPESDIIPRGEEPKPWAMVCGGSCIDCLCRGTACWTLKQGEKIYFFEH